MTFPGRGYPALLCKLDYGYHHWLRFHQYLQHISAVKFPMVMRKIRAFFWYRYQSFKTLKKSEKKQQTQKNLSRFLQHIITDNWIDEK